MPDQPQQEPPKEPFNIPLDPTVGTGATLAQAISLVEAAAELRGYALKKKSALTRSWWDWIQAHLLKWTLFAFVIWINIWWTKNVLKMVWLSGSKGSYFHLDNNVLIALVSTSIASFLALVIVVAKNLFPESK